MDVAALLRRWQTLPGRTRTVAAGAASLAIAASVLLAVFAHPSRTVLFIAPLHAEQLAEVQERLASWNVTFSPTADNVVVDASKRNELLLRLSMAGVPHAHVDTSGELLGKLGALTPQAVIDEQTRDGLAGDIELALRGIDGVQDARVIVAPAKAGDFADESSAQASASVRLRMIDGARLSGDAVAGVRAFVAASVAGLDAKNVTILDDRGIALEETPGSDQGGELQRSLQSALDDALGNGAAIVRVHVEYDRRTITSKDVRRTPASALPIAAQTQEERFAGGGKRYDKSAQQLDRGSETHESLATTAGARPSRITAAVLVDAARVTDLLQVRALADATLGIEQSRGDTVEVEAVNFAHAAVARKDGWWLAYGALVPLLPTLVLTVAALVALGWAREPLAQLLKACTERAFIARTAQAAHGIAPDRVRSVLANEPPHAAAAIISALPAATAAAVLDLYPEHERAAIVRRMQCEVSPLVPDARSFIANA